jgi:hypothetical protein
MTAVANASFQRLENAGDVAGSGSTLKVQFNPTEFSMTKGAQLAEIPIPGLDQPIIQFVRGQTETMSVELFFDSTEDGTGANAKSVTEKTDVFYSLIKIDPEAHAPPVLLFKWGPELPGARHVFKCVVTSVRQHFTMFSPTGIPLRAKLTVELREYKTLTEQIYELNLQSADQTKAWRLIADANAIDDPLALEPAAILRVPKAHQ